MKIAVLGTGEVGKTLADGLLGGGHAVRLGSRTGDNEVARAWADAVAGDAGVATFEDAAAWADMGILAVSGAHSLSVLGRTAAGLQGKVLIDLTNPLDFSGGFPPRLSVCNDDSLGEQLQRAHPAVKVVKVLNTVHSTVMLNPGMLDGPHELLMCGDDADAKAKVVELLTAFGWADPIDLGGIDNARGLEMWLPLWVRLYRALGTGDFNIHIQRKKG